MPHRQGTLLGGSLLVAGTTIGGGMLALPVLTSPAGFVPSILIYFLCWAFMASTGLLFLEISQWFKQDANIITMAEATLGRWGKGFAWILYLFLFYCLTVAYMVGCGNILVQISQQAIPDWLGPILFVAIFAPFIMIPTALAGRLNVGLVIGLALSYVGFVGVGVPYVNNAFLKEMHWQNSLLSLPIAFTAFAYQGIIPTLTGYMQHDMQKTRRVILLGSFIPLLAYIVWEWLILGIVPREGPQGLLSALQAGNNAVEPLHYFIQNPAVYYIGQAFAFFALVTSFLGVTLGLRDFLADGFSIQKDLRGKLLLALMVFLVPLFIAVSYPHLFLIALDYAGGFGVALLLGLLPILMTWVGRYRMSLGGEPQLFGGQAVLGLLTLFVVFELIYQMRHLLNKGLF